MTNVTEHIRTTCPRDCYDTCRIVVVKQEEKIMQVRGDPAHPINHDKLCAKCSIAYNREWLDPNVRLTHPLRRIGRKGEGKFEPISWETALTTIAERFKQIVATSGAQTILNAHYTGTISLLAYLFPLRFSSAWALEECGLAYQVHGLDDFAGELRSSAYLAINPFGKVPAIDHEGLILFESGAILA